MFPSLPPIVLGRGRVRRRHHRGRGRSPQQRGGVRVLVLASTTGTQPLVAHVRDAAAGTVVLYIGHDEVVVHDHDLVRRLTRAARR